MRRFISLILFVVIVSVASDASADNNAMTILKQYEKQAAGFKAFFVKYKLYIDGKHSATLTAKNRRNGQRLTKLLYPGDVKGMQILIQSKSEMYIYLPAFRKVRRIAGHVRNQGFLGSGFSYDDMAMSTWSKDYTVKLVKTTRKYWHLDLRALPGKKALHHHIKMRVLRKTNYTDRFQYFNERGKNIKTQHFLDYKCNAEGYHCNPMRIRMIEHTRANRVSELRAVKLKYFSQYPDRIFSIRNLLRSAN